MEKKILKSPNGSYDILQPLGKTKKFKLYSCRNGDKSYILKIAATTEHNALIADEAEFLSEMRGHAALLEDEYMAVKSDPNVFLNYQLCFPDLHESFISERQGGRRVNILDFHAVPDLRTLVPVRHITTRDKVRVDCKTSAWMMGKLLKFLTFSYSQNISPGRMTGDNVLIEREQHFILFFDMTAAAYHQDLVPADIRKEQIAKAAAIITIALGGDATTGEYYEDGQDPQGMYASYLYHLACGGEDDASRAHTDFYKLVESLWPREYWPYTTFPLQG